MQSFFGAKASPDPIRRALTQAPLVQDVGPWKAVPLPLIGGLTALGFDRNSEDMLVTSHNGQSVISGETGEVLYRNRDADGLDMSALKGTRLDHPADERFDMAGIFGGALRSQTDDGWSVEQITLPPDTLRHTTQPETVHCVLHPKDASLHFHHAKWDAYDKDRSFRLLAREQEDIRAFGFSWSGRTLALATSSDVKLWHRPSPLKL